MRVLKFRAWLIAAALGSASATAAQSGLFGSNPAANVSILPIAMASPPIYRGGVRCRFQARTYRDSKKQSEEEFSIETKAVAGKILVTHTKNDGVSSILLSIAGQLLDFNVLSGAGGRTSPDSGVRVSPFYRDAPTFFHPYFPPATNIQPETLYGEIAGPDKKPVARLLYRGKVSFSQPSVYVFDVMGLDRTRAMPNGQPFGRLTIDSSDALPRLLVLGAATRVQYRRISCGPLL